MSDTVILTPDSSWRGCSAKFSQPLSVKDQGEAQFLANQLGTYNNNNDNIVYRTGDGEKDIRRQVFRWDLAPYKEVFQNGLQVHRPQVSPNETFYSLNQYVEGKGSRPLDSRTVSSFTFISTTVSNSWYPPIPSDGESLQTFTVYRYEIYAPGGIWVSATLGSKYPKKVARHDEVVFVGGIAPQYIRSAQAFSLTGSPNGTTILNRADNMLHINGSFNPQSHPLRFLNIENPVSDYTDGVHLVQRFTNNSDTSNPNIIKWYANDVADRDIYLSSAFRASRNNEAYYILANKVTQLYYDHKGNNYHMENGPSFVSEMFPSLEYTPFGEHGIDAAFQLQGDEAIIFASNLCALINYAPNTKKDTIIMKGPMTISEMFPLLKGTVFENGLDAAFESKLEYEYFLFKGTVCAHIRYELETEEFELIKIGQIAQIIPILKGTIFEEYGIDAAYGSHAPDEVAYVFQSKNWAILKVDLNEHKDDIYGPKVLGSDANVIAQFAPRKNRGLDMRDEAGPLPTNPDDYDHDQVEPTSSIDQGSSQGHPCGDSSCGPPWGGPPHQGPFWGGRGGPHRGGPHCGGPNRGGPHCGGPHRGGPHFGGPHRGGPHRGGPFRGGPFRGGPHRGGPHCGGPPRGC